MMLAMDQFKDVAGFARYAVRLRVGPLDALRAWLAVAVHEATGRLAPRIQMDACDPALVGQYFGGGEH